MNPFVANPAFPAFAATTLLLCLNLLFLWGYSGAKRGGTKTAVNPEDAERFGATLRDTDPPEVARILRAHRNAEAAIYPFLLLGLSFVLAGGSRTLAMGIFSVFVVARFVHSWAYLTAKQPWRTISFLIAGVATIVLMLDLAWLLLR